MDHEALKEQWGEAEDRDGIRLSWNVFPSSRMVESTRRWLKNEVKTD
jgi:protein transport protein SEC23